MGEPAFVVGVVGWVGVLCVELGAGADAFVDGVKGVRRWYMSECLSVGTVECSWTGKWSALGVRWSGQVGLLKVGVGVERVSGMAM
eukprot:8399884-Alexandrium_andersonii.AAC.1